MRFCPERIGARLAGVALLLVAAGARAEALNDHDNGPLSAIFGIPDSTEGAMLLADGRHAFGVTLMTSSHAIVDDKLGESLTLDGETTRLTLNWRYGFSDRLEIGIEAPLLSHESGNLDSLIENWHDIFGLPDGSRDQLPQDELLFSYQDTGVPLVDFDENANGAGDVRLYGGWQLSSNTNRRTALRLSVKLPTGAAEDLLGSGGTDVSVGIAADYLDLGGTGRMTGFYRANVIYVGEPEFLADRYNEFIGHLAGGIGIKVTNWMDLRVQGTIRSAMYDSDIRNLGDLAGTITFGGNFRLGERTLLSLAVGEDIIVNTAPDVSFQVTLRYQPR